MKWLQLSNLHFGYSDINFNNLKNALIEYVKKVDQIDFILISGDCMYCNKDEGCVDFILELGQACNCSNENIFICPGNHDINRSELELNTSDLEMRECPIDSLLETSYRKFKNIYEKTTGRDYSHFQITERNIGNEKYRIVSIDSCLLIDQLYSQQISWKIWPELEKMGRQIKDDECINILTMHHSLDFFEPRSRRRFKNWIEDNNIDLVFCGHSVADEVNITISTNKKGSIEQFSSGIVPLGDNHSSDFWICQYDTESSVVEMGLYTYSSYGMILKSCLWNGNSYRYQIPRKIGTKKEYIVPYPTRSSNNDNNRVFLAYGHDEGAKQTVARFLEQCGLEPVILHEQVDGGKTIIEKIEQNADVIFAIVLYTPCDIGRDKNKKRGVPRARQNVVFEHGYLIGKLGRNRVCALVKQGVETPSDISGVVYKNMDSAGAWKTEILKEMKSAGIVVNAEILLKQ